MVFIKHNSLNSGIYILVIYFFMFFRIQVFQSPAVSGSRFFGVQFFQALGPDFSRSGSMVRVQVLEVVEKIFEKALCCYLQILKAIIFLNYNRDPPSAIPSKVTCSSYKNGSYFFTITISAI